MDVFLLFGVIVPFITFMIQVALKLVGGPEKRTDEACVEIKLQEEISSTESNIAWPNKNETPKSKKVPTLFGANESAFQ